MNYTFSGVSALIPGLVFVFFADGNGLTNLFSVAGQVVSVFAALFVVFVIAMAGRVRFDVSLFVSGSLSDHHRTDCHFSRLTILAVFSSLFGTVISATHREVPVTVEVTGYAVRFNLVWVLVGLLGWFSLTSLALLFLSLPQYYLERSKSFRFGELQREFFEAKYRELHPTVAEVPRLTSTGGSDGGL